MSNTTDGSVSTSSGSFSEQERDVVRTLNTYLKTIDGIDPLLLDDRPCIDLSLPINTRK